jgi:hypothetical protein
MLLPFADSSFFLNITINHSEVTVNNASLSFAMYVDSLRNDIEQAIAKNDISPELRQKPRPTVYRQRRQYLIG